MPPTARHKRNFSQLSVGEGPTGELVLPYAVLISPLPTIGPRTLKSGMTLRRRLRKDKQGPLITPGESVHALHAYFLLMSSCRFQ